MDGLLLVDKPLGWTSHDAVAYIRRALGEKHIGHTGTLDPDATGLLIALIGKAARLARFFENDEKEYIATMRLGSETDTQDASGRVIRECPVPELSAGDVEAVLSGFTGEIEQVPPMYSAIKQGGTPLYKQARAGREVERAPRRVTIKSLELLGIDGPLVTFRTLCSKGTYIRTLGRDIGEALGSCSHLSSLRRTAAGGYGVDGAVDLSIRPSGEELSVRVRPVREMLPGMPFVVLTEGAAAGIRHGRSPAPDGVARASEGIRPGRPVRIMDSAGGLLAVGEARDGEGAGTIYRLKVVLI